MYHLDVTTLRDAVVVPSRDGKLHKGVKAGVLAADGRLVRRSLLRRSWGPFVHPPDRPDPQDVERDDREVIFGGFLTYHFGHFLLESLSRLWATEAFAGCPIVWGNAKPFSAWQREIMDLLAVDNEHIFLDGPTAFARVHVPAPGYVIQKRFADRHRDYLAKVAAAAPIPSARTWLSRTRLGPELKRVSGEERLEARLAEAGWRIFHPERHSVREQLGALSSSGVVAGIEGSAFHSVCLIDGIGSELIVLRRTGNANYRTIAESKGLRQLDIAGHVVNVGGRGPDRDFVLNDPEVTARFLDRLSRG